jgi:thiamine biosynthesis protein ThiS
MDIYINGEMRTVAGGMTVAELVSFLRLVPEQLAIEYNLEILKREKWDGQVLAPGDKLEIVHFVGGG